MEIEMKTNGKKKCHIKMDKSGTESKNAKKRKVTNSLVTKENGNESRDNSIEDIPDFNHIPSDSSDEESNIKEETKPNNNVRKKAYTDFTENTVFVGNVPLSYDKKKIIKVFSKFGQVVCARIRCVPIANINMRKKVAAIKKEFNPKRSSAVAYVKFKSEESVNAAVAANGMILDGHHLRIDFANSKCNDRDVNKAIFVGGLPFDIEDDELWEFFENCGKINSVRVVRDSHITMGKGIGYVNFDSTASVELALQMDGQELKKRTINVNRCISNCKTKDKLKMFGKNKTKEMVGQLLSKKNKTKLKMKNIESKKNKTKSSNEFLGVKATLKKKKKKKPSKDVLRKRKIMNLLKKQ